MSIKILNCDGYGYVKSSANAICKTYLKQGHEAFIMPASKRTAPLLLKGCRRWVVVIK